MRKIFLGLIVLGGVFAIIFAGHKKQGSKITVVAVQSAVVPTNASLQIVFPKNDEIETQDPVNMQVKIQGYPLGVSSQYKREDLVRSNQGQTVRVVVDNEPYFSKTSQRVDPFNDEGNYYEGMIQFNLPNLTKGQHIVRTFLASSFNESLKSDKVFDAHIFYYKTKEENDDLSLQTPYLTYNEPSPLHKYREDKPILLDFLIQNCVLSKSGYRVKLTIDKRNVRYLDRVVPYYIYGLKKGNHVIELELVGKDSRKVKGFLNYVKTNIEVN